MPDDFAPPRPRVIPCVPRYPSVPATDGPRGADEQGVPRLATAEEIDLWSGIKAARNRAAAVMRDCRIEPAPPPPTDELEQARQARDLLMRLVCERKIVLRSGSLLDGSSSVIDLLVIHRLVPRVGYDEEPLP